VRRATARGVAAAWLAPPVLVVLAGAVVILGRRLLRHAGPTPGLAGRAVILD